MNRWISLLSLLFIVVFSANCQNRGNVFTIDVKKTGPYIGLQKGKYTVAECGVERQWKEIRLTRSITHAAHLGFNYNFRYNVLGYDMGYWVKPNRIGLTYGANLVFRTDFNDERVGFAPVIGFKFYMFHLQTGYHFLTGRGLDFPTNTFFISLRVGWINDRDFSWGGKKK